ncbi:glycosyltransferase family 4 protein [Candidatus Peregrinibacteria bacterium]|nr:MAG: glycosyltransferase family 4 protein [Candidatus Peregrinibacteria bacterium]
MKILMYGWEFPPINSGGLGVACKGIVEGLIHNGQEVYLVLPKVNDQMRAVANNQFKILTAHESGGMIKQIAIPSGLYSPYASPTAYHQFLQIHQQNHSNEPEHLYGPNLMEEMVRFAEKGAVHAQKIPHDVIHTHDWLTAEAGIQAKQISDQPLVMHIHATEFDRSGEHPNQQVFDLERRGMEKADRVIAVSHYTKQMLIKHYGIPEHKIDVVHNAVENAAHYQKTHLIEKKDQIVLFLGRMTMQKGPDYFLKMAKRVLEHKPKVKFVMAGDGDMMERVIHMAIELGIERNVLFSGFLKGDEVAKAYGEADLYVMPSVSEPFGIAPLEAIRSGAPVLISKQSGVSEIIKNALRTDFWDVDEMANQVLAVLNYPALRNTLKEHGEREVQKLSWAEQAKHMIKTYGRALSGV